MATTLNIIANSRTPYSVIISIENADGAEGAPPLPNLSRATLTAASNQANALADGPLKELIRRTSDLRVFNQVQAPPPNTDLDDCIRITSIDGGLNQTLTPATHGCVLNFTADALEASIFHEDEGATPAHILVELRIVHSNER